MGLRWQITPEDDIKLSGALAKVAMDLGYLTQSEEYANCFVEDWVVFSRSQVQTIVSFMADLYSMGQLTELDVFKYQELRAWISDSEETEIVFA